MDPDRALELTRGEPRGVDVGSSPSSMRRLPSSSRVLAAVAGQAPVDLLDADLAAVPAHVRDADRALRRPAREHDRDRAPAEQVAGGSVLSQAPRSRCVSAIASSRSLANAAMCGWICSRCSASAGSTSTGSSAMKSRAAVSAPRMPVPGAQST